VVELNFGMFSDSRVLPSPTDSPGYRRCGADSRQVPSVAMCAKCLAGPGAENSGGTEGACRNSDLKSLADALGTLGVLGHSAGA